MVFLLGIAVTTASIFISFVWPQKPLAIRLALLGLGLIGIALTADRYFQDQRKAQQTLEYWEVARLNAFGLHFIGGDLEDHTELNHIIGAYIHDKNGKVVWDCTSESIQAYRKAMTFDPKFPFSYFYRATCNKVRNAGQWEQDADIAQRLFRITTQISGHNQNHNEILRMIDRGDLGRRPS
jgi:hypothetical protein